MTKVKTLRKKATPKVAEQTEEIHIDGVAEESPVAETLIEGTFSSIIKYSDKAQAYHFYLTVRSGIELLGFINHDKTQRVFFVSKEGFNQQSKDVLGKTMSFTPAEILYAVENSGF